MRMFAVALALTGRLAWAQLGTCDAQCTATAGIVLATALVVTSHAVLGWGLYHDNEHALAIGGWSTLLFSSISALSATGFLVDSLVHRHDGLAVGGLATWLALSVGVIGVAVYGVHRSQNLPAVYLVPVTGGVSGGFSVSW
ncbi:MAG: hypothetical protein JNK82_06210 [Myxococcaceae bacterium]|nr:hypothetical protein [Myxococcaceae bacterium]